MNLLVSALMVLSVAHDTVPARAVHYGRLADSWMQSRLVCKGMTSDQVNAIIGRYRREVFLGPQCFDVYYYELGFLVVQYDPVTMRVSFEVALFVRA